MHRFLPYCPIRRLTHTEHISSTPRLFFLFCSARLTLQHSPPLKRELVLERLCKQTAYDCLRLPTNAWYGHFGVEPQPALIDNPPTDLDAYGTLLQAWS
jgi:hypothetical protein